MAYPPRKPVHFSCDGQSPLAGAFWNWNCGYPERFWFQWRQTHPELLDFLTSEFKQQQYSIKAMHRLIVTSATYAQACIPNINTREEYKKAAIVDADNRLFWRFPSLRLEGEVVRDAMLAMG